MKRIMCKSNKIVSLLLALLIVSCACNDNIPKNPYNEILETENLYVTGSLLMPEMPDILTRGIMGETPKANLKLTIFEFDKGSDAEHSFLSNIYNAEITPASATAVANNGIVNFKFTLKAANTSKVLHLFLSDSYLTSEYGSVATILPALTVGKPGSEYEAYWGYAEFDNGFTDIPENEGIPNLLTEVSQKLTDVPMIRNFAKITVEENLSNFELLGFDIVNVPTSGTVAPWDKTNLRVPSLLNNDDSMKSYLNITYSGIVPGNAQFRNTETDARNWATGNKITDIKNNNLKSPNYTAYMYEHPYESTRRSYLIIYGKYTDDSNESTYGFYKLDIGVKETNGNFKYYNIIRNIHYKVLISRVYAAGSATIAEAIARAPFNNLIAATETSSMLNVSNGKNLLIVNDTNHIIVDDNKTVDILYRYIERVTGDKNVNNEVPHFVIGPGDVIKNASEAQAVDYTDNNKVTWKKIELKINNPSNTVKTQTVTIVDDEGLGRTINLILRRPWQYEKIGNTDNTAIIAPNTNNLYTTPIPQTFTISKEAQEPATVYFNLPEQLPESMFPLDFTLEAKNQGLESHKSDNMVVTYGPSLFNSDVTSIQYVKTVTYLEYMHPYLNDGSNDVNISVTNTNHTIRCRFLTTTTTTGDGAVKIHNEYFKPDAEVKFERK